MQGVGWIPITPIDVEMPYWLGIWLGVFPTVETAVAQAGAAVFVVGSYLLAERLKRPARRPPPPVADRPAPAGHSQRGDRPHTRPRVRSRA
jgi:high-affinity iron transporter